MADTFIIIIDQFSGAHYMQNDLGFIFSGGEFNFHGIDYFAKKFKAALMGFNLRFLWLP